MPNKKLIETHQLPELKVIKKEKIIFLKRLQNRLHRF